MPVRLVRTVRLSAPSIRSLSGCRGYRSLYSVSGDATSSKHPYPSSRNASSYERTTIRTITSSSRITSPHLKYKELAEDGTLRTDSHQETIIAKLQSLHDKLIDYKQPPIPSPTSSSSSGFFSRILSSNPTPPAPSPDAPRGMYLYGDVGTGKSMLMDLFYDTLPPNIKGKRRVHFHAFMIEIHKALHKQAAKGIPVEDAIAPVATELAREVQVLCFDEFQVTDIVDAMILRRLLERLIDCGVIMVMTSNRHPDDLYKNGIQRESFVPAIELMKTRLDVTDLNSGTDYRKIPRALSKVYFHPINHEHRAEFDKLFNAMAGTDVEYNRSISVWGRNLNVPESGNGAAKFTFAELCGNPLSAADYIAITNEFNTIFVEDIPLLNLNSKDRARRFITFIDACYEGKTKLFTLSEVPIFEIFSDEKAPGGITDHMRSVMDDLGLSSDIVGSSSIFTGDEEIFAFARACSRLVQMGSKQWADASGSH